VIFNYLFIHYFCLDFEVGYPELTREQYLAFLDGKHLTTAPVPTHQEKQTLLGDLKSQKDTFAGLAPLFLLLCFPFRSFFSSFGSRATG